MVVKAHALLSRLILPAACLALAGCAASDGWRLSRKQEADSGQVATQTRPAPRWWEPFGPPPSTQVAARPAQSAGRLVPTPTPTSLVERPPMATSVPSADTAVTDTSYRSAALSQLPPTVDVGPPFKAARVIHTSEWKTASEPPPLEAPPQ
jgi:hypothetical protein